MSSNEWYTPQKYMNAVHDVMGGIDLDPASCHEANQIVKAAQYYTKQDNGLALPWYGRVWLNPPFGTTGRPQQGASNGQSTAYLFMSRLIQEYEIGHVSEAVLLAKADPKQRWFSLLWNYDICFCVDRVYFIRPDGPPERNQFGTCFVYLGDNNARFIQVFKRLGVIVPRNASIPYEKQAEQLRLA